MWEIINGDSVDVLKQFQEEGRRFDCIVADPPYCSGGARFADKKGGAEKYVNLAKKGRRFENNFADGMDQISFIFSVREIFALALSLLDAPGYAFIFSDWRQYGATSVALQTAGYTWRGCVVWNKKVARPNRGAFPPLAEFVVWGTKKGTSDKFAPGVFAFPAPLAKTRIHPTEKPPEIFDALYQILPDGARILDPYCGSGAAGVAAARRGLDYTGIEILPTYADAARERLQNEARRLETLELKEDMLQKNLLKKSES